MRATGMPIIDYPMRLPKSGSMVYTYDSALPFV
jgi:hypothetical protein